MDKLDLEGMIIAQSFPVLVAMLLEIALATEDFEWASILESALSKNKRFNTVGMTWTS